MVAVEEEQEVSREAVERILPLGMLLALLVFAVSACGGDEQRQESKARPLPEVRQALRPGTYSSEEFKPSLSFRIGDGWSTSPPEMSDALLLTRGHETAGLGFANAQEVYKPTKTGIPDVVEAPEDLVGWFQRHPYLQTDKPEPVTVGGVKGVQFDVVVENLPEDQSGVCGSDCVDIFRLSGGCCLALREGDTARVVVLEDVEGETVTIGFTSPAAEFDEFAPEAQKVIDSVEWGGS